MLIAAGTDHRVRIATDTTDMRKGMKGMATIVIQLEKR